LNRLQASIKLRPTATWTYFPYFCGLTRNDIGFYITISVDIIFFKDSIGASPVRASARAYAAHLLAASDRLAEARLQTSSTPATPS